MSFKGARKQRHLLKEDLVCPLRGMPCMLCQHKQFLLIRSVHCGGCLLSPFLRDREALNGHSRTQGSWKRRWYGYLRGLCRQNGPRAQSMRSINRNEQKGKPMGGAKFTGMLTLLGAALGCSVGMLAGVLSYSSTLGRPLVIGAAAGAVAGFLVGIVCVLLKNCTGKRR